MQKIFAKENKRIDIKGILNHNFVKNAPRTLLTITKPKTNKSISKSKTKSNQTQNEESNSIRERKQAPDNTIIAISDYPNTNTNINNDINSNNNNNNNRNKSSSIASNISDMTDGSLSRITQSSGYSTMSISTKSPSVSSGNSSRNIHITTSLSENDSSSNY